jgi:cell division protein FtsW
MDYLKQRLRPDYKIALLAIGLSIFGIIMIDSASGVIAFEKFSGANNYYYVWHQIIALVVGIILMGIFSNIDYRRYKKIALPVLIATLVLLILVFLPGIGSSAKGAHRWLNLGFSFQPSELAKISFILYLCAWLDNRSEEVKHLTRALVPFVVLLGIISLLIILEPDLGTLAIIIFSSVIVFFVAGAPVWQIASLGGFLALVFAIFIRSESYRWKRFLTFLNPASETLGRGYHINQAYIAVSQGGLWGLGFGKSIQKMKYLPEPHTDSIFAIICEELGFLRSAIVIVAYFYLFILGLAAAKKAPDNFGRLLAVGIVSTLLVQALINIAAMLGLVPLTGVTLPFVSYGGTSLVISFIQIGILLNISKYAQHNEI